MKQTPTYSFEELNNHYDNWCRETKRNGSVLIGSMREFFKYLSEIPTSPTPSSTSVSAENWLGILERHNPTRNTGIPGWVLNAFSEYAKQVSGNEWVSVEDELPEDSKPVLCAHKTLGGGFTYYVGVYAHKNKIVVDDFDGDGDFDSDENKGECYLKPGWYEEEEQVSHEYDYVWLERTPTHWQPLPKKPI